MPHIKGGYVMIPRNILANEIWSKPPLYFKVWSYLLLQAQHTQYQGLRRGQCYTSIPQIQEACSWRVGFRRETPTKQEIYRILKWLRCSDERDHEHDMNETRITTTKVTHGMLVNLDHYNVYQDPSNYERDPEHDAEKKTSGQRTDDQDNNINKNVKNEKNNKNVRRNKHRLPSSCTSEPLKQIEQHFVSRRGRGTILSARDIQAIESILKKNIPLQDILVGIDYAFEHYQPRYVGDQIQSFAYCVKVICDRWSKKEQSLWEGGSEIAENQSSNQQHEDPFQDYIQEQQAYYKNIFAQDGLLEDKP